MRRDKFFGSASRKTASRKTRGSYARQLAYESLENRQMLAATATFVAATGVLTIDMPLAADDATLTLNGATGEYELNATPITNDPTPANVKQLVVTAFGGGANDFKLNAAINPVDGIDINDGFADVATVEFNGDITGVDTGKSIDIDSDSITLNANIRTDGGSVTFNGPLTLAANAEIDTDVAGGASKNAGSVSLDNVDGPFNLKIDATTDDNATAGAISLFGIGSGTALKKFEAFTEDQITMQGSAITTDGPVDLRAANLLFVAFTPFQIDTEQGGNDPGGAVNISADLVQVFGAVPGIMKIDTRGVATQPAGAVTLPPQFTQVASTPGFKNFEDPAHVIRIQVATTQLFFENFALPTANTRFNTTFFTQTGASFKASPPAGRKAIATIVPTQITPATPPAALPVPYTASTTATLTTPPPAGRFSNAYIVFDHTNATNFKFAGAFAGRKQFSIGEVKNGVVIHKATAPISGGPTFNLSVEVNPTTGNVTLSNNGLAVVAFSFGAGALSATNRQVGVGTNNAMSSFTNIALTG